MIFDSSTSNTANIEWYAASDLSSNEIEAYRIDTIKTCDEDECSNHFLTQTNSFVIPHLTASTNYRVWVSVIGIGFGQSEGSDYIEIHTKPSSLLGKNVHFLEIYTLHNIMIPHYFPHGLHLLFFTFFNSIGKPNKTYSDVNNSIL